MNRIYLDYSATTPIDNEVLDSMLPYFKNHFGNASSIHFFGQTARVAVEKARYSLAQIINCKSNEIYFTSGGTEAINFALMGMASYLWKNKKNHIISSAMEHKATLETLKILQNMGFEVDLLLPNENGLITLQQIENSVRENSGLISLMFVNNETGHINDIESIGKFCRENNIIFHCDAVQAFCKIQLNVSELKVDLLSSSAHKIFGPKGIGFLYGREGIEINPIIFGGSQEKKKRGGTESVPLIVGFSTAANIFDKHSVDRYIYVSKLKEYFYKNIEFFIPKEILLNSPLEFTSPYILNFSYNPNVFSISIEGMMMNLDIDGIAVSTGSACTSGASEVSHVIKSLVRDESIAKNSLRISFSHITTFQELDLTISTILKVLNKNRIKK